MKYKDSEFTIKKVNLELYRIATPLILFRNKKLYEYCSIVDRSLIKQYEKKINELKLNIERAAERQETEKIKAFDDELETIQYNFETDSRVEEINLFYLRQYQLAVDETLCNIELLKEIIPKIVDGNVDILDYEDPAFIAFAKEVIDAFFLSGNQKKII